jgi:hypothetical protein
LSVIVPLATLVLTILLSNANYSVACPPLELKLKLPVLAGSVVFVVRFFSV